MRVFVAFVCFVFLNFVVAGDVLRSLGFDLSKIMANWRPVLGLVALSLLIAAFFVDQIAKSGKTYLVEVKFLSGSLQGKTMELRLKAKSEEDARAISALQAQNYLQSQGQAPSGFHVSRVNAQDWEAGLLAHLKLAFKILVLMTGLGLTGYGGYTFYHSKPVEAKRRYTGKVEHKDYGKMRESRYEYVEGGDLREGSIPLLLGCIYLFVGTGALALTNKGQAGKVC